MNWKDYKFRCSALGKLTTNPQGVKDPDKVDHWSKLSETTKTYLLECYIREVYGRDKEILNKYIEKGLQVEEDSITLYSRTTKTFFKKNEERLSNDYITGTPDLFTGSSIQEAETIIDIKSSWDIHTFFETISKPLNKNYVAQINGYCALSGAKTGKLVYCLVDTPPILILDEQRRLGWKVGIATEDWQINEVYNQACEYLEKSMTYSDIDINDRYIENQIPFDKIAFENIVYKRIDLCREFLTNLKVK